MKNTRTQLALTIALAFLLTFALSACNNGRINKSALLGSAASTSTLATSGSFVISQVQETITNNVKSFTVNIQSNGTALNSSGACGAGGKDCVCVIRWVTIQPDGIVSVPNQPTTSITSISANSLTCAQPDRYINEVTNGTTVKVSLRRPSDLNTRVSNEVDFAKGLGSLNTLSQSLNLNDISRYTCSNSFSRDTAILTGVTSETSTSGSVTTYLAHSTRFCIPGSSSSGASNNCAAGSLSNVRTSNQRNIFNFYTRSNNLSLTSQNTTFVCPEINTGIESSASHRVYPLDRSFRLSNVSNADFFVPVEANVKASGGGGDPSSTGISCGASGAGASSGSSSSTSPVVVGCLGFAAKPTVAGSCPSVTQTINGTVVTVPTYRLRKYFAVYPQNYERDGSPSDSAQSIDTVYILDRPVYENASSTNVVATVLGPKPCPFAYRDVNSVIAAGSTNYYATNDPAWAGKNLDGIVLPGTTVSAADSCLATFPTYENPYSNSAVLKFTTVSNSDPYYIRPIQPWTLHYEEDTSFQACAPLATNPVDPPLHFNGANYCAEVHPNTIISGTGANQNTLGGTIHTGATVHDISAVTFGGAAIAAPLPLLAPKANIESALNSDPSFGCRITSILNSSSGLSMDGYPSNCCTAAANRHFEPSSSTPTCKAVK